MIDDFATAGLSLQIDDFGLHSFAVVGVLAQLVERLVRNEKVRSSSLLGSTKIKSALFDA